MSWFDRRFMAVKSELGAARVAPIADEAEEIRVTEGSLRPTRIPLRTLALFLVGALAVGGLLYTVGVDYVASLLGTLGWSAPLVLLPHAFISFFDALGWARTLGHNRRRLSIGRLYCIRHAGEAISNLTPSAGLGGEPLKAYLLRRHGIQAGDGVASLVIAKTAMVCSQFLFTLLGLFLFLSFLGLLQDRAPTLVLAVAAALAICVVLVVGQRRGFAARTVRLVERLRIGGAWLARLEQQAEAIDDALVRFYRDDPRGFATTLALDMTAWLLGATEVMFLFYLMGVACDWRQALIIESLTQATIAASAIIPGGLGVQEISGTVICRALGIGEAAGAALMLLKRGREMVFTAIGVALISWLARGTAAKQ